ncbi:MAG: hypothetical protein ACQKBW_07020, partial [Puniceicoccales bacterium]
HFPAYVASGPSEQPVYTASAPVSVDRAAPVAGMAKDFSDGSHQATFVVGQFDSRDTTSNTGNVTMVAASRPMPVESNHNVHYVGGSFDGGFGSESPTAQARVY